MGDFTERIVTILTADVSGLEQGAKKSDAAYDKLISKNKEFIASVDKAAGAGGLLQKALSSLGSLTTFAGQLTALAGGIGVGFVTAVIKARSESQRFAQVVEEMGKNAIETTSKMAVLSKDSGVGALGAQYQKARLEARRFREEEEKRTSSSELERFGSALGRGYNNVTDFFSGRQVGDTNEIQKGANRLANKAAEQSERKAQEFLTDSLRQQEDITKRMAAGRTDDAAILNMELQARREIAELAEIGLKTDVNVASINEKTAAQIQRIKEDRARIVRDAEQEARFAEMTRKGQTDLLAIEQQKLKFAKEIEAITLSGGTPAQVQAALKQQESQRGGLEATQALEKARFGGAGQIARVGGDLSIGDTQRQFTQTAMKLEFLRKELALSQKLGITDQERRALMLEEIASTNTLAQLRSQYRSQQAQVTQRGTELGISGSLTMGSAAKEAALAQSKLDFLQRELTTRQKLGDISKEEVQQMQLQAREAKIALEVAQARARTERDSFEQRKREQQIAGTNAPFKGIAQAASRVSYLRGQLARTDISDDARRELTLELGGAQNDLRQSRQDAFFDLRNKPGERNALMAKMEREATERDKFDAKQALIDETGSVIGGDRGSSLSGSLFGAAGTGLFESAGAAALSGSGAFAGAMAGGLTIKDAKKTEAQKQTDILKDIKNEGLKIR